MLADPILHARPAPKPGACAECGVEPLEPWAPAASGDGVVCSPRCAALDAITWHGGGPKAVAAVRDAADVGVDGLPELAWTVELEYGGTAEVVGFAVESSRDSVTVEDRDGESGSIAWADVVGVAVADDA